MYPRTVSCGSIDRYIISTYYTATVGQLYNSSTVDEILNISLINRLDPPDHIDKKNEDKEKS